MAKACIEAPGTHTMGLSIKDMLIGADPFEIGELWRRIYLGTAMNGRRGMVIHAMSAVDMALWDLCGKAVGKPVHALLGGATRERITPYASLQPAGRALRGVSRRALRLGRARQGSRLHGDEDRDHHERPLRPWRHARELRPAHRGAWPPCARPSARTSR